MNFNLWWELALCRYNCSQNIRAVPDTAVKNNGTRSALFYLSGKHFEWANGSIACAVDQSTKVTTEWIVFVAGLHSTLIPDDMLEDKVCPTSTIYLSGPQLNCVWATLSLMTRRKRWVVSFWLQLAPLFPPDFSKVVDYAVGCCEPELPFAKKDG